MEMWGLLAAILVIQAGMLAERAWRWGHNKRHNNNNNPSNSKMFYEMTTNMAAIKTRLEAFAQLTDTKFDYLRERVTKLEIRAEKGE